MATIAGHNRREKEGATCGGEGGISNIAREGKEGVLVMTGTAVVVQENNTKLFNQGSDFRRSSIFRLTGYSGNSINKGNLNRNAAVDGYIPIP